MIGPGTGVRVYLACGVTDIQSAHSRATARCVILFRSCISKGLPDKAPVPASLGMMNSRRSFLILSIAPFGMNVGDVKMNSNSFSLPSSVFRASNA